ncbi:MAG: alpha/beta hydrolase [Acidimicrobiia bacterium]
MTLRKPPKDPNAATRIIGRLVGLVLLLVIFALVIWVASTNQQAAALESSPAVPGPAGRLVEAGDVVINVREYGAGDDTVVLIHDDQMVGGALLVPLAEELVSRGRRVLVPDLVGYGLSARPVTPGRIYSTAGQTDTLASLLDEEGVGNALVVGFGWGGGVAAELAVAYPDLVSSLALVDTPDLPVPSRGWDTLEALPFGVGDAVAFTREGASSGAEARFRKECSADSRCDDATLEFFREAVSLPGTSSSIRARRASERASVAPDRLDEITAATLITSSNRAAADALASRFPDATAAGVGAEEISADDLP